MTLTMASTHIYTITLFFFFLISSLFIITISGFREDDEPLVATMRMEKVSHLRFYFHDIVSGKTPTAVRVAGPNKGRFGETVIADDPLTEGPDRSSKLVGRAQGLYAVAAAAAAEEVALLMVMSFAFVEGKYNGSSISVVGRNPVFRDVREMPVLGGTGLFRYARGYALAHTVWFNTSTGDAVVQYNVTVLHF